VLPTRHLPRRLAPRLHPVAVEVDLPPFLAERASRVESELSARAALDRDRCWGYFPALRSVRGLEGELPACHAFASSLPRIRHGGADYSFNFLRLSLTPQSVDPAYHLDSDADTALTGDVTTLKERRVTRLLLTLSSRSERAVHYLNIDPASVDLAVDGSYIRVADPSPLAGHGLTAIIAARRDSHVAGLLFAANLVLHSGVDGAHGHFVAAYGIDAMDGGASRGWST
jgi:hypothetical protein